MLTPRGARVVLRGFSLDATVSQRGLSALAAEPLSNCSLAPRLTRRSASRRTSKRPAQFPVPPTPRTPQPPKLLGWIRWGGGGTRLRNRKCPQQIPKSPALVVPFVAVFFVARRTPGSQGEPLRHPDLRPRHPEPAPPTRAREKPWADRGNRSGPQRSQRPQASAPRAGGLGKAAPTFGAAPDVGNVPIQVSAHQGLQ